MQIVFGENYFTKNDYRIWLENDKWYVDCPRASDRGASILWSTDHLEDAKKFMNLHELFEQMVETGDIR